MQTTNRQLKDMDIHDEKLIPDWKIIRVPGGWIYSSFRDMYGTSVFVPEISLNMGGEPYD